jgi:triphosphatase
METELKLLIDASDKEKLRRHPLIGRHAAGPSKQAEIAACYFDTPDFHVRRHDAGLSVRKSDGRGVQTLQAGGGVRAGLCQRQEWECPVEGERPDLEKLRGVVDQDTEWAAMLNTPSLANRLQPLFSVRITRLSWDLRIGGDEIELAFDQGTIECKGKALAVSEIALALKSGKPARLYELALQLLADIPMRLGNLDQAERGYALCGAGDGAAVKARAPALARDCSVEQGLQAILAACLAQIQGNEAGVVERRDGESVHQMRVGLRRLDSALRLFGTVPRCPSPLREEIAWLSAELGAARDWEVLATSTLARVPANAPLAALEGPVRDGARAAREQAAAALLSTRYARLLIALFDWMQGARWREGMDADAVRLLDEPLVDAARGMLRRGHRKVVRRAKKAALADAQAIQSVRIAARQHRYAIEFLAPLLSAKRVRACLAPLKALQDELGERNDVAVADGLLRRLPTRQADARLAAAFARGYLAGRSGAEACVPRAARKKIRRLALPFTP